MQARKQYLDAFKKLAEYALHMGPEQGKAFLQDLDTLVKAESAQSLEVFEEALRRAALPEVVETSLRRAVTE